MSDSHTALVVYSRKPLEAVKPIDRNSNGKVHSSNNKGASVIQSGSNSSEHNGVNHDQTLGVASSSKTGISGTVLRYSGVTEDHHKGTLHWHLNVATGQVD